MSESATTPTTPTPAEVPLPLTPAQTPAPQAAEEEKEEKEEEAKKMPVQFMNLAEEIQALIISFVRPKPRFLLYIY